MSNIRNLDSMIRGKSVLLLGAGTMSEKCLEADSTRLTITINGGGWNANQLGKRIDISFVEANVLLSKKEHYERSRQVVKQHSASAGFVIQGNPAMNLSSIQDSQEYSVICHHSVHEAVRRLSGFEGFYSDWDSLPSSGLVAVTLLLDAGARDVHLEGFSFRNSSHSFDDRGYLAVESIDSPFRQHSRPDMALLSLLSLRFGNISSCSSELQPMLKSFEKSRQPKGKYSKSIRKHCYCN